MIYLHKYGLMNIYFVLWVLIQHYWIVEATILLLQLVQLWLLEALSNVLL